MIDGQAMAMNFPVEDPFGYESIPLEVVDTKYMYDYPRPSVTTDVVVFWVDPESTTILVLLIKRGDKTEACAGMWALPGGYMEIDETLVDAASRELREETSIELYPSELKFVGIYDRVDRDDRGRVLTVAYVGRIFDRTEVRPQAEFVEEVEGHIWISATTIFNDKKFELAFDHRQILLDAFNVFRGIV